MSQLKVNSIIPVSGVPTGGGGGIIQVKQTAKTDTFSNTNTSSHVDVTGLSVTITPTSATSKILIELSIISGHSSHTTVMGLQLVRDTTAICIGDADGNRTRYTTGMHTHFSNAENIVLASLLISLRYLVPGIIGFFLFSISSYNVIDSQE